MFKIRFKNILVIFILILGSCAEKEFDNFIEIEPPYGSLEVSIYLCESLLCEESNPILGHDVFLYSSEFDFNNDLEPYAKENSDIQGKVKFLNIEKETVLIVCSINDQVKSKMTHTPQNSKSFESLYFN